MELPKRWKQFPGLFFSGSLEPEQPLGPRPLGLPSAQQCQRQAWGQAGSQAHPQEQQLGLAQGGGRLEADAGKQWGREAKLELRLKEESWRLVLVQHKMSSYCLSSKPPRLCTEVGFLVCGFFAPFILLPTFPFFPPLLVSHSISLIYATLAEIGEQNHLLQEQESCCGHLGRQHTWTAPGDLAWLLTRALF